MDIPSRTRSLGAVLAAGLVLAPPATADETFVESINLPGASMEQEVTYHSAKADYLAARDGILVKLKAGDSSAFVNPAAGPWMQVETTASIGLEVEGVGASSGRKKLRQVSAAEEALFLYDRWKAGQ